MKEFLKKVSVLHYQTFREMAMRECNWNYQQYNNRLQGRTKVTPLEAEKLNDIVKQLTKKK